VSEHLSLFTLERDRLGESDERARAHVGACDECATRLRRMETDDRTFMIAKPNLASIGVGPKKTIRIVAPLLALAACVLAMVSIAPPDESTRMKGDSSVELFVRREGQTFPYAPDVALRQGDTLLFRYTSLRKHMLLAGVEASGDVSIFVPDAELEPGQNRIAPQGLELDDYRGEERVILLLSDRPLDPHEVECELRQRAREDPLSNPRFEYDADQVSWLIRKGPE
jgi:hypothetical protein